MRESSATTLMSLSPIARWALMAFLGFSLIYFTLRGPVRAVSESGDFTAIYLATSLWLQGDNPYNLKEIDRLWSAERRRGVRSLGPGDISGSRPAIYPPSTYPVFAPLAWLRFEYARNLWAVLTALAYGGALITLLSIAYLKVKEWPAILLLCLGLSLNPVHFAIKEGNPNTMAVALLIFSLWFAGRNRSCFSGVLFALAICFKPQIALAFSVYFALRKTPRILIISFFFVAMILFLGIVQIGWNLDLLYSWKANLDYAFNAGPNDPALVGGSGTLNLSYLFYSLFRNNLITNIATILFILGCAILLLLLIDIKSDKFIANNSLLILSFIAVFNLLACYHRSYDASLLLFVITLAITLINEQSIFVKIIFLMIMPFLLPSTAGCHYLAVKWKSIHFVSETWIWNQIILFQSTWLLLLMLVVLTYLLHLRKQSTMIRN